MQLRLHRLDRQGLKSESKRPAAHSITCCCLPACIQLCLRACEHAFGCEGSRANFCRCFPERKVPNRTPLDGPIGFSLQHPSSPCSPSRSARSRGRRFQRPALPVLPKAARLGCRIEQVLASGLLRGRSKLVGHGAFREGGEKNDRTAARW